MAAMLLDLCKHVTRALELVAKQPAPFSRTSTYKVIVMIQNTLETGYNVVTSRRLTQNSHF